MIDLKTPAQVDAMRQAGRMVAQLLQRLQEAVLPGVMTGALDTLARETIAQLGGTPAFKGYRGFPGYICTSVNEEVVHGIPGRRILKAGDIVGLDVGVCAQGYYADAAITVPVGPISEAAQQLIAVTREALARGMAMAVPGRRLSDISHAVQTAVESAGFSVVREYVGHGIGTQLHEDPQIPNYGSPGTGPVLKPGMVLAIEPMVTAGRPEVELLDDGWTAVTKDRRWSAHFEHTVAITEDGPDILTQCPKKKP